MMYKAFCFGAQGTQVEGPIPAPDLAPALPVYKGAFHGPRNGASTFHGKLRLREPTPSSVS